MLQLRLLLKHLIAGMEVAGAPCDTVVVGSDELAGRIREELKVLELDYHVIVDDELGKTRMFVTSQDALSKFPGGCAN